MKQNKTRRRLIFFLFLLIIITIVISVPSKLPYIQNFEEDEFSKNSDYVEPTLIADDLAVYTIGDGDPVLLFPYPHAHTIEPMAQGPISKDLVNIGRKVITFDVPGAYQSTGTPNGSIEEILTSAERTMELFNIREPIDVVGHSMGGLTALAFAIRYPERVKSLVLIGSMSGFPVVMKYGMPKSVWEITDIDYWKFIFLGLKIKLGFGNLADHKKLYNTMVQASFFNKDYFEPLFIEEDDSKQGVPIREIVWGNNIYNQLDFSNLLSKVQATTLILVGRYDPEAPIECSEELNRGILNSKMIVFEKSGHFPFLEEEELFVSTINDFYSGK